LKDLQPEFEPNSMPIYAYKCESCGFAKDVLQKMSDAVLTDCPDCHAPAFKKQVTAAGFQLKGSGWYATDFKGGPPAGTAPKAESADSAKSSEGSSDKPATPTPAATPSTTPGKTDA
jgi:putative FmdB family regulatory protein